MEYKISCLRGWQPSKHFIRDGFQALNKFLANPEVQDNFQKKRLWEYILGRYRRSIKDVLETH
jgi:hypothetical protein